MSGFSDTDIAALASAERVYLASLFALDFASGAMHLTEESVEFRGADGTIWQPSYGAISFSDLPGGPNSLAQARRYTMPLETLEAANAVRSGVAQEDEFRGRRLTHFVQFFKNNREAVGTPIALSAARMDTLTVVADAEGLARAVLSCESLMVHKNRRPSLALTAQDQKKIDPDDTGLDRVADLIQGARIEWPKYPK